MLSMKTDLILRKIVSKRADIKQEIEKKGSCVVDNKTRQTPNLIKDVEPFESKLKK